jgi:hypothetical protein
MLRGFCLGFVVLIATPLYAQDPTRLWLNPTLGQLEPSIGYDSEYAPKQNVGGQDSELGFTEYGLRLRFPVWQNEEQELSSAIDLRALDFDTGAYFPDTSTLFDRDDFPSEIYDLSFGATYRRKLDNDWIAGFDLAVSSPSDKPFAGYDEMAISATGFLRVPHGDKNAWAFFLNYNSNREFLQNIPIPGVAYEFNLNRTFSSLLGVPLSSVHWEPTEFLTIDALYFIPRTIRTRVSYLLMKRVTLYTGYEWTNDQFLRRDREDNDDRLFHYEQRVKAGVRWEVTEKLYVDLNGGYAFDRFFFEGEDYGDRGDNRLDIGDGPFVAARLVIGL